MSKHKNDGRDNRADRGGSGQKKFQREDAQYDERGGPRDEFGAGLRADLNRGSQQNDQQGNTQRAGQESSQQRMPDRNADQRGAAQQYAQQRGQARQSSESEAPRARVDRSGEHRDDTKLDQGNSQHIVPGDSAQREHQRGAATQGDGMARQPNTGSRQG